MARTLDPEIETAYRVVTAREYPSGRIHVEYHGPYSRLNTANGVLTQIIKRTHRSGRQAVGHVEKSAISWERVDAA